MGFDEVQRLQWYRENCEKTDINASEYRTHKKTFRSVVRDPHQWLAEAQDGERITRVLEEWAQYVSTASTRLHLLVAEGLLGRSVGSICASLVHLHLNRIGAAAFERTLLYLLFRTYRGLSMTP